MTAFPNLLLFALPFGCVCGALVTAAPFRPAYIRGDAPTRADAVSGTPNDGRGSRGIFWQLSNYGDLWKGHPWEGGPDYAENAVSGEPRVRRLSPNTLVCAT